MIKTVLFDVDGVIIPKKGCFSINFSREFNVPIENLTQFFENEFKPCLVGKADLKKEVKKYFDQWNYKKSVDELLKYWFDNENETDQALLDNVKDLRSKGIKCFLTTNNEKYRTEYIFESIGLKKYFDGMFSSSKIGCLKLQPEFWQSVYAQLGSSDKKTVLLIDDDEKNIQSAKDFGFQAELYTSFDDYKNKIKNI